MRKYVKEKIKSGAEKVKSGASKVTGLGKDNKEGKEKKDDSRQSMTIDSLTAEQEDERYRRKMERAAREREEAKTRHRQETIKGSVDQEEELKQGADPDAGQPVGFTQVFSSNELQRESTMIKRKQRTNAISGVHSNLDSALFSDVMADREHQSKEMRARELAQEDSDEEIGSQATVMNTFKSQGIGLEKEIEDQYNTNAMNQSSATDFVDPKKYTQSDIHLESAGADENVLTKKVKSEAKPQVTYRTFSIGNQEEFLANKQIAASIVETNQMGALEESTDMNPLKKTATFLEEMKQENQAFRQKSGSVQVPKKSKEVDYKAQSAVEVALEDFQDTLMRRNMTLNNRESKQVEADKSPGAEDSAFFKQQRNSKKGEQNDAYLQKMQSELEISKARISNFNTQSQQDKIIEFSKNAAARKSAFIPDSEISEKSSISSASRSQVSSISNPRREAIIKKKRPILESEKINEKVESSDSETSYDQEDDIDSENLSELSEEVFQNQMRELEKQNEEDTRMEADDFVDDLLQLNDAASGAIEESKVDDMIVLIDKSEHLFITYAQEKLVKNKALIEARARENEAKKGQEKFIHQRVLNGPTFKSFGQYEPHLRAQREKQKQTCLAVSDEVIVFGTNTGALWAYNKETQKLYGRYENSDREMFEGNSVNCIQFHPLRMEYVVVGYQGGQIIMLDLTENENGKLKSKKVIKDHHRGSPLVSVKFCDWIKEREASVNFQALSDEIKATQKKQNHMSQVEDKQAWMIASVDIDGKIVITTITNVAFGLLSANKFTIVDPVKDIMKHPNKVFPRYQVIETRFFDSIFPQGFYNDSQTWLALASKEEVQILQVSKESCNSCFGLKRPRFYPSERTRCYVTFPETVPVVAWGYGRTPIFKHRTYALMAVAWGPLIQIILLVPDEEKNGEGNDFITDGQYFIAPGTVQDTRPGTSDVVDVRVESMSFLSESILLVYTSTQDIRVLYTQSFHNGKYESPNNDKAITAPKFDEIDSRLKLMDVGSAFTKHQLQIELERKKFLSDPVQTSVYGLRASQTLSTSQDWVVFLTEKGIYQAIHLTWQESLELDSDDMQSTWIETFQRVIDIFEGKIKGFKGTVDDKELRQEFMKAELKQLVTAMIEKIIIQWKARAIKMEQTNTATATIHEDLQEKYRTLIKRTIELCVDIWEPFFLFNELFQKFVDQGMSNLFSEELQPYILAGTFSDTDVPEDILDLHILRYPFLAYNMSKSQTNDSPPSGANPGSIRQSPAENFEKILVNINFSLCSDSYINKMINFCRENRLSTGLFYLCINTQGEQGTAVALCELRNFYQVIKNEETKDEKNGTDRKTFDNQDLLELENMPANFPKRETMEKSAVYVGYKLLWVIRLLLLGKRFPKGHFEQNAWHDITHEVLNIITQEEFMRTLCEIDGSAFFQIVTIVFNNPSKQYDFLIKGRPVNRKSGRGVIKIQMTHAEIVKRISDYCMKLNEGDEIRLQYLFFIASIAGENQELRDADFYYKVTQELLQNNIKFLHFNKNLLNRQMTNKQLYRKLSRKGFNAPDKVKHIILSEENIMKLMLKCEPLSKEMIDELVEQIQDTDFNSLKLVLYEKQENYIRCLKLLVENESASSFVTTKMQDRFAWILEKYNMLELRLQDRNENTQQRYQFDLFEGEIISSAVTLVRIDPHKTVGLADGLFHGNHQKFLDKMVDHPAERFEYVCKLLELQSEKCKQEIQAYTLQTTAENKKKADIWQKVLRLHLELACQEKPAMVINIIRNATKENYYPMEEYLKICEQQKQTEACALLFEQIGGYNEAVQYYIKFMDDQLDVPTFQKELFEFDKYIRKQLMRQKRSLQKQREEELEHQRRMMKNQQQIQSLDVSLFAQMNTNIEQLMTKDHFVNRCSHDDNFKEALYQKVYLEQNAPNIDLIERVLKIIVNIFTNQPNEVMKSTNQVWQTILTFLFSLYQKPELRKKRYARRFITQKIVSVVREMLKFITLSELLEGTLIIHKTLRFKGIKLLTSEVFWDKRAELDLTTDAKRISMEENKNLEEIMFQSKGVGLLFRYTRCDLCMRNVNQTSNMSAVTSSLSDYNPKHDNLILFECPHNEFNHVFHDRCIKSGIKTELMKDKKAAHNVKEVSKSMRCLACYKQSQDISEALAHYEKRTRPSARERRTMGVNLSSRGDAQRKSNASTENQSACGRSDYGQDDNSDSGNIYGRSGRIQKTLNEQRFERMGKKLDLFDHDLNFDTLELGNFKKHK